MYRNIFFTGESNYNATRIYFININNKKHIRSEMGPLKNSVDNVVTDNQRMTKTLNINSVFNTT